MLRRLTQQNRKTPTRHTKNQQTITYLNSPTQSFRVWKAELPVPHQKPSLRRMPLLPPQVALLIDAYTVMQRTWKIIIIKIERTIKCGYKMINEWYKMQWIIHRVVLPCWQCQRRMNSKYNGAPRSRCTPLFSAIHLTPDDFHRQMDVPDKNKKYWSFIKKKKI